jgi:plasmid maintenance system antidote protein VapI
MGDEESGESWRAALLSEEHLAWRIEHEMQRRGWSQERMAQEMTDAGYPIHQTAISKIIKPRDGKRRAISVDEAIGFAKVFGSTLEGLLSPAAFANADELKEKFNASAGALGSILDAFDLLDDSLEVIEELIKSDDVMEASAYLEKPPYESEKLQEVIESNRIRRYRSRMRCEAASYSYLASLRAECPGSGQFWVNHRLAARELIGQLGRHLTEMLIRTNPEARDMLDTGPLREWLEATRPVLPRYRLQEEGERFGALIDMWDQGEEGGNRRRAFYGASKLSEILAARKRAIDSDQAFRSQVRNDD